VLVPKNPNYIDKNAIKCYCI